MFASPKKRDKVVNNKEVEKTFTTIVIPLIHETKDKDCFLSPKKPSTLFVSNSYGNSFSNSNSTKDSVGNDNRNRDGDCCDDNNITKNKSNSYDDHHRKSNSASAPSTTRARATNRTGGRNSFTTFSYDKITLLPAESKRVYKVLSIKDNSNNYSNSYSNYNSNSDSLGRKLLFDGISGKIYHCGAGQAKNISKNVICFDTKDSALSERFPYDQVRR